MEPVVDPTTWDQGALASWLEAIGFKEFSEREDIKEVDGEEFFGVLSIGFEEFAENYGLDPTLAFRFWLHYLQLTRKLSQYESIPPSSDLDWLTEDDVLEWIDNTPLLSACRPSILKARVNGLVLRCFSLGEKVFDVSEAFLESLKHLQLLKNPREYIINLRDVPQPRVTVEAAFDEVDFGKANPEFLKGMFDAKTKKFAFESLRRLTQSQLRSLLTHLSLCSVGNNKNLMRVAVAGAILLHEYDFKRWYACPPSNEVEPISRRVMEHLAAVCHPNSASLTYPEIEGRTGSYYFYALCRDVLMLWPVNTKQVEVYRTMLGVNNHLELKALPIKKMRELVSKYFPEKINFALISNSEILSQMLSLFADSYLDLSQSNDLNQNVLNEFRKLRKLPMETGKEQKAWRQSLHDMVSRSDKGAFQFLKFDHVAKLCEEKTEVPKLVDLVDEMIAALEEQIGKHKDIATEAAKAKTLQKTVFEPSPITLFVDTVFESTASKRPPSSPSKSRLEEDADDFSEDSESINEDRVPIVLVRKFAIDGNEKETVAEFGFNMSRNYRLVPRPGYSNEYTLLPSKAISQGGYTSIEHILSDPLIKIEKLKVCVPGLQHYLEFTRGEKEAAFSFPQVTANYTWIKSGKVISYCEDPAAPFLRFLIFGFTPEDGTTKSCLEALSDLSKTHPLNESLDLLCDAVQFQKKATTTEGHALSDDTIHMKRLRHLSQNILNLELFRDIKGHLNEVWRRDFNGNDILRAVSRMLVSDHESSLHSITVVHQEADMHTFLDSLKKMDLVVRNVEPPTMESLLSELSDLQSETTLSFWAVRFSGTIHLAGFRRFLSFFTPNTNLRLILMSSDQIENFLNDCSDEKNHTQHYYGGADGVNGSQIKPYQSTLPDIYHLLRLPNQSLGEYVSMDCIVREYESQLQFSSALKSFLSNQESRDSHPPILIQCQQPSFLISSIQSDSDFGNPEVIKPERIEDYIRSVSQARTNSAPSFLGNLLVTDAHTLSQSEKKRANLLLGSLYHLVFVTEAIHMEDLQLFRDRIIIADVNAPNFIRRTLKDETRILWYRMLHLLYGSAASLEVASSVEVNENGFRKLVTSTWQRAGLALPLSSQASELLFHDIFGLLQNPPSLSSNRDARPFLEFMRKVLDFSSFDSDALSDVSFETFVFQSPVAQFVCQRDRLQLWLYFLAEQRSLRAPDIPENGCQIHTTSALSFFLAGIADPSYNALVKTDLMISEKDFLMLQATSSIERELNWNMVATSACSGQFPYNVETLLSFLRIHPFPMKLLATIPADQLYNYLLALPSSRKSFPELRTLFRHLQDPGFSAFVSGSKTAVSAPLQAHLAVLRWIFATNKVHEKLGIQNEEATASQYQPIQLRQGEDIPRLASLKVHLAEFASLKDQFLLEILTLGSDSNATCPVDEDFIESQTSLHAFLLHEATDHDGAFLLNPLSGALHQPPPIGPVFMNFCLQSSTVETTASAVKRNQSRLICHPFIVAMQLLCGRRIAGATETLGFDWSKDELVKVLDKNEFCKKFMAKISTDASADFGTSPFWQNFTRIHPSALALVLERLVHRNQCIVFHRLLCLRMDQMNNENGRLKEFLKAMLCHIRPQTFQVHVLLQQFFSKTFIDFRNALDSVVNACSSRDFLSLDVHSTLSLLLHPNKIEDHTGIIFVETYEELLEAVSQKYKHDPVDVKHALSLKSQLTPLGFQKVAEKIKDDSFSGATLLKLCCFLACPSVANYSFLSEPSFSLDHLKFLLSLREVFDFKATVVSNISSVSRLAIFLACPYYLTPADFDDFRATLVRKFPEVETHLSSYPLVRFLLSHKNGLPISVVSLSLMKLPADVLQDVRSSMKGWKPRPSAPCRTKANEKIFEVQGFSVENLKSNLESLYYSHTGESLFLFHDSSLEPLPNNLIVPPADSSLAPPTFDKLGGIFDRDVELTLTNPNLSTNAKVKMFYSVQPHVALKAIYDSTQSALVGAVELTPPFKFKLDLLSTSDGNPQVTVQAVCLLEEDDGTKRYSPVSSQSYALSNPSYSQERHFMNLISFCLHDNWDPRNRTHIEKLTNFVEIVLSFPYESKSYKSKKFFDLNAIQVAWDAVKGQLDSLSESDVRALGAKFLQSRLPIDATKNKELGHLQRYFVQRVIWAWIYSVGFTDDDVKEWLGVDLDVFKIKVDSRVHRNFPCGVLVPSLVGNNLVYSSSSRFGEDESYTNHLVRSCVDSLRSVLEHPDPLPEFVFARTSGKDFVQAIAEHVGPLVGQLIHQLASSGGISCVETEYVIAGEETHFYDAESLLVAISPCANLILKLLIDENDEQRGKSLFREVLSKAIETIRRYVSDSRQQQVNFALLSEVLYFAFIVPAGQKFFLGLSTIMFEDYIREHLVYQHPDNSDVKSVCFSSYLCATYRGLKRLFHVDLPDDMTEALKRAAWIKPHVTTIPLVKKGEGLILSEESVVTHLSKNSVEPFDLGKALVVESIHSNGSHSKNSQLSSRKPIFVGATSLRSTSKQARADLLTPLRAIPAQNVEYDVIDISLLVDFILNTKYAFELSLKPGGRVALVSVGEPNSHGRYYKFATDVHASQLDGAIDSVFNSHKQAFAYCEKLLSTSTSATLLVAGGLIIGRSTFLSPREKNVYLNLSLGLEDPEFPPFYEWAKPVGFDRTINKEDEDLRNYHVYGIHLISSQLLVQEFFEKAYNFVTKYYATSNDFKSNIRPFHEAFLNALHGHVGQLDRLQETFAQDGQEDFKDLRSKFEIAKGSCYAQKEKLWPGFVLLMRGQPAGHPAFSKDFIQATQRLHRLAVQYSTPHDASEEKRKSDKHAVLLHQEKLNVGKYQYAPPLAFWIDPVKYYTHYNRVNPVPLAFFFYAPASPINLDNTAKAETEIEDEDDDKIFADKEADPSSEENEGSEDRLTSYDIEWCIWLLLCPSLSKDTKEAIWKMLIDNTVQPVEEKSAQVRYALYSLGCALRSSQRKAARLVVRAMINAANLNSAELVALQRAGNRFGVIALDYNHAAMKVYENCDLKFFTLTFSSSTSDDKNADEILFREIMLRLNEGFTPLIIKGLTTVADRLMKWITEYTASRPWVFVVFQGIEVDFFLPELLERIVCLSKLPNEKKRGYSSTRIERPYDFRDHFEREYGEKFCNVGDSRFSKEWHPLLTDENYPNSLLKQKKACIQSSERTASAVLMVGPPGIGKSAFLVQLEEALRQSNIFVQKIDGSSAQLYKLSIADFLVENKVEEASRAANGCFLIVDEFHLLQDNQKWKFLKACAQFKCVLVLIGNRHDQSDVDMLKASFGDSFVPDRDILLCAGSPENLQKNFLDDLRASERTSSEKAIYARFVCLYLRVARCLFGEEMLSYRIPLAKAFAAFIGGKEIRPFAKLLHEKVKTFDTSFCVQFEEELLFHFKREKLWIEESIENEHKVDHVSGLCDPLDTWYEGVGNGKTICEILFAAAATDTNMKAQSFPEFSSNLTDSSNIHPAAKLFQYVLYLLRRANKINLLHDRNLLGKYKDELLAYRILQVPGRFPTIMKTKAPAGRQMYASVLCASVQNLNDLSEIRSVILRGRYPVPENVKAAWSDAAVSDVSSFEQLLKFWPEAVGYLTASNLRTLLRTNTGGQELAEVTMLQFRNSKDREQSICPYFIAAWKLYCTNPDVAQFDIRTGDPTKLEELRDLFLWASANGFTWRDMVIEERIAALELRCRKDLIAVTRYTLDQIRQPPSNIETDIKSFIGRLWSGFFAPLIEIPAQAGCDVPELFPHAALLMIASSSSVVAQWPETVKCVSAVMNGFSNLDSLTYLNSQLEVGVSFSRDALQEALSKDPDCSKRFFDGLYRFLDSKTLPKEWQAFILTMDGIFLEDDFVKHQDGFEEGVRWLTSRDKTIRIAEGGFKRCMVELQERLYPRLKATA